MIDRQARLKRVGDLHHLVAADDVQRYRVVSLGAPFKREGRLIVDVVGDASVDTGCLRRQIGPPSRQKRHAAIDQVLQTELRIRDAGVLKDD